MRHPALPLLAACLLASAPAAAQTDCWIKRDEGKPAPLLKAAQLAEELLRKNAAFARTPAPARMLTAINASDAGASLTVTAFPERSGLFRVWVPGKCAVHPTSATISAALGEAAIHFNPGVAELFLKGAEVPKDEGSVGGYPVFNGRVVLTRDKRLPWIPQTLADRLDREQAAREKKLADLRKRVAALAMPNAAQVKKSYDMLRETDPAGADRFLASMGRSSSEMAREQLEVYPAMLRQLEGAVDAVKRYRASFSAAQLAAPARWTDASGDERRKLDAKVKELRPLSDAERAALEKATLENRAVARRMQEAIAAVKTEEAARLRAELVAQTAVVAGIQKRHNEQAALKAADLADAFALEHLKPGDRATALAWKADPSFADPKNPGRIRLITVAFAPNSQDYGRGPWMKEAAASFDYAALATLLP